MALLQNSRNTMCGPPDHYALRPSLVQTVFDSAPDLVTYSELPLLAC